MKQCPVCQKPVSDFALECPHCKANMDTKPQPFIPASAVIPVKAPVTSKADYLAIVLLSLVVFFISGIIQHFESLSAVRYYGEMVMVAYTVIHNDIICMVLTGLTALLIMLAMHFYHRRGCSIKGYLFTSLWVFVLFCLLHVLLSYQILPPELFVAHSMVVEHVEAVLPTAILVNAFLYPGYVLIAYWGIITLGKKKGYLAAAIGAVLLVIDTILRTPLSVALRLSWTAMFYLRFPILAYLLFAGVLMIMKITSGKK